MPAKYKVIASVGEEDLRNLQKKDTKDLDLLEIRLDLFSRNYIQKELKKKVKSLAIPVLLTYRRAEDSNMKSYVKLFPEDVEDLMKDFNSAENYLDIELNRDDTIFAGFETLKYQIVYSYHSFKKSISQKEMKDYISNAKPVKSGKPIFKFAITPEDINEAADFLSDIKVISKSASLIGVCMGEAGIVSRVFGESYGSSFTYITIGEPKAPGQIPLDTFRKLRPDLFK
ncbi:MAG: type I 3-dehydroquinate dehydratase [Leptospira sp.]|nr:type I 3-dehydroquinate dehydratase [Leptospira sp.]NCS93760.1 type I 3-dehydroquinate dehydratase [Leptospira sp.]